MTDEQLKLVQKMRDFQKQYFEARRKHMHVTATQLMPHCKAYEAKVDKMIEEELNQVPKNQASLF